MAKPAKAVFGQEENPTQKRVGDLAVYTTVSETASGSRLHVTDQKLNGKNEKKKKKCKSKPKTIKRKGENTCKCSSTQYIPTVRKKAEK